MRCHYENIKGIGKVLIPGCMAVAVSGDIDRCTCMPTTIRLFETPKYKEEVERLKGIIRRLEQENDYYADILERNQIKNEFEREKSS